MTYINATTEFILVGQPGTLSAAQVTALTAAQSDMETATSTVLFVTPGRVKYNPGVAKAWIYYIYSGGTPTSQRNFNITSLTDNGVGDASINFTTAFSDTLHTFNGNGMSSLATPGHLVGPYTSAMSATLMRVLAVADDSAAPADNAHNFACFFGDQ